MMDEYEAWVAYGVERGWLGRPFCYSHEDVPMAQYEGEAVEAAGGNMSIVCLVVARLFHPMDRMLVQ
jgi:hypothetical protein